MSIIKISIFLIFLSCMFAGMVHAQSTHLEGWEYFYKRGTIQYRERLYKDAADSMIKALRRKGDLYQAANVLAEIKFIQRDRYAAIEYYELSLSVNDSQPGVHNSLGELLEYFAQYDRAIEHYTRGHALDPEDTRIMINLARILVKTGRLDESLKYYNMCREKGMPRSRLLTEEAERIRRTDPAGAAALYRNAISFNPAHTEAYIGLADCYRQTGENEKAAAALEDLKKVNPRHAVIYIQLGNIYYNNRLKGNTRKYYINLAIKNYEEAIKLQPGNPDLYFELAAIMEALGERDRADRLLETADRLTREGK
ncbi:MAG: tetratricopeptide repeat protein [Spirochaetes bacterium]|nr:tetratricopeptide repeat protein [Spirochaetota bacterium]